MRKNKSKYQIEHLRKLANEIIRRDQIKKVSSTQIKFMEERELLNFIAQHGHLDPPDNLNPLFIFSLINNVLLCAAVNGEIILLELAKETLASRGYNASNQWVGFMN